MANSANSGADPFFYGGTTFIFGNSDNPNMSADQTPSQTSTATATTALPGGSATSNVAAGPGASLAPPGKTSSAASSLFAGMSTGWLLIIAGVAILAWHFFGKKL